MRQAQIFLNNKELLLVELPEDFDWRTEPNYSIAFYYWTHSVGWQTIPIPEGNWNLIGKLSEVTEEQAHELVSEIEIGDVNYGYEKYMSDEEFARSDYVNSCATAKESFFSALTASGIFFKNPLGEQPPDLISTPLSWDSESLESDIAKWQSAQEEVFNIDNTFLFEKV